jgi:hypothetical protein
MKKIIPFLVGGLSLVAFAAPARAAEVTLKITTVIPSSEFEFCDIFHQAIEVSPSSNTSRVHVPFSFDGAGGLPSCGLVTGDPENFSNLSWGRVYRR